MNVNGVAGFFPLTSIRPSYVGYYMTANGDIHSTRQYKTPKKLAGTIPPNSRANGRVYSFTTTGGNRFNRLPVTERGDVLFAEAKRHADFARETGSAQAAITRMPAFAGTPITKDRDHAGTTAHGIQAKGYIIGQVQGEAIVFGSKPVIHTTLTSVKDEVARLAAKSPGTQIIYVKIEGSAVANGIHWA